FSPRPLFLTSLANPPAPPHTSTLSLHDALPIWPPRVRPPAPRRPRRGRAGRGPAGPGADLLRRGRLRRRQRGVARVAAPRQPPEDRKSTRLNSSHVKTSYAVFCLKKKKAMKQRI